MTREGLVIRHEFELLVMTREGLVVRQESFNYL